MRKNISAKIEELHPLLEWIRHALHSMPLSSSRLGQIELAAEEVFVNIIEHGYKKKEGQVEVVVDILSKTHAELSFKDWAPPFNPLEVKEKERGLDLDKEPIGGLGISLVRKIVDEIRYTRQKDANLLTLVIRSA